MSSATKQSAIVPNFFGGLGYLSVILQWLWSAALLLPALLANEAIKDFLLPQPATKTSASVFQFDENSLIVVIISVVVTIIVLVVSAIILVRLPLSLIKTTRKTVDTTVNTIIPIASHHKKITKKERTVLSVKIRQFLKVAIVIIPLFSLCSLLFITTELRRDVIILIACLLAIGSIVWFSLQQASARLMHVRQEQLI